VSRVWERLSAPAVAVMRLAGEEAGRLGQDYIGDEHVLLGLLRYGDGPAVSLLTEAGVTPTRARAGLASMQARGLTPGSHPGSPQALQILGIDVEEVRQRLTAMFGADAVAAAVRRASRRPWWRGGRRVHTRCAARRCSLSEPCISPPSTPARTGTSARSICCTACCATSQTLPGPGWPGAGARTLPS
jgi:hypothetical protein